MRVNALRSIIVCFVVGMFCSSGYALNLLGPSNAELEKGQIGFGAEYSMSDLAMDFDFTSGTATMPDFSRDDIELDSLSGMLGYGFLEIVEGFFRIGMVDVCSDESGSKYDGDGTFYGLGAKVTLNKQEEITWGLQVQFNMVDTDGKWNAKNGSWMGDSTLEFWEIVVAAGPKYQFSDFMSVYGGPFWYMLDGEKTYDEISPTPGWYEKYDVENQSDFGGFVGLQLDVPTDAKLNLEYQMTSDDDVIGLSLMWRY